MQTCDPFKARQAFKLRFWKNIGIALGVFVSLVWILQFFLSFFLTDVIALAVAFILFFFYLRKRIFGITCSGCTNYIETDTPWKCGHCGTNNIQVYDFPFVNRCGNNDCELEPKAYKCHHCGQMIFLSNDRNENNFAQCVNMKEIPKPVLGQKDANVDELAKRMKDIKITELDIQKAKLDIEHNALKADLEPKKVKTPYQELEEYYLSMVGNEEAARKWRVAIDEEFKLDKDEREKRHIIVDQWVTNRLK